MSNEGRSGATVRLQILPLSAASRPGAGSQPAAQCAQRSGIDSTRRLLRPAPLALCSAAQREQRDGGRDGEAALAHTKRTHTRSSRSHSRLHLLSTIPPVPADAPPLLAPPLSCSSALRAAASPLLCESANVGRHFRRLFNRSQSVATIVAILAKSELGAAVPRSCADALRIHRCSCVSGGRMLFVDRSVPETLLRPSRGARQLQSFPAARTLGPRSSADDPAAISAHSPPRQALRAVRP